MKTVLTVLLCTVALSACGTPSVNTVAEPGLNASGYEAWAWLPREEMPPPDPMAQNPMVDQWIRGKVGQGLAERGFGLSEGSPDFLVTYHTEVKDALGMVYRGYGYGGTGGPSGGRLVGGRREGKLYLKFLDAESRKVIYQATVSGIITDQGSADRHLEDGIADALDRFAALR